MKEERSRARDGDEGREIRTVVVFPGLHLPSLLCGIRVFFWCASGRERELELTGKTIVQVEQLYCACLSCNSW